MPFENPPDAVAVAALEADDAEDPVDLHAPVARQDREPRVELQHLAGGQPRLVAEQLGQVADATPRRAVAERPAEDRPVALGRPREAEQQLDRRRLAGAVRAEQAEHLAAVDAQVEGIEGDRRAVGLAEAADVDGGIGHGRAGAPGSQGGDDAVTA